MKIAEKLGDKLASTFVILGVSAFLGFMFFLAVPTGALVNMSKPFQAISIFFFLVAAASFIRLVILMIQGNRFEKGKDKASASLEMGAQFVTVISKYAYDENQLMQFPVEPGIVESGTFYIQVMFTSGEKDELQVSESLYFSVGEMMKGNATIHKRKMTSFTPILTGQSAPLNESEWNQK